LRSIDAFAFADATFAIADIAATNVATLGAVLWRHIDGSVATAGHNFGVLAAAFQIGGIADFDRDGGVVLTSYQVRGVEDFDSDGDADILWCHANGQVVTWTMEGSALQQTRNFGITVLAWQVVGTGEFDGV
jgi:hypothetical protein